MEKLKEDIVQCITVLQSSGIILYPTDTIWGLGCEATNTSAMIRQYVSNPAEKILEYLSVQSTPTTAVFNNAINLPSSLVNTDGTIAIRIARDEFCQALLQKLKRPLVSTSANISGEVYPQNFHEINDEIKNGVDYIVQYRQNDLKKYAPSSIIKLDTSGEIIHLR